jgi:glycosidase
VGHILDGVFNHVGERHRWLRDHPDWFRGSDWRGYPSLRELDTSLPAVRRACCDVVAAWTRKGGTGWRLDCMNDLGPAFAEELAAAARAAGAVDGVIGEVMAYGGGWLAAGGALSGVMNYWLRATALALAEGAAPATQLQAALDRLAGEVDPALLMGSWALVGSHDTPRLCTVLDGNEAAINAAQALSFAYPGIPMIYYGDEVGMPGGADPDNRQPLIAPNHWHRSRLARTRRWCQLRRTHPALRRGRYVSLAQPGCDVVAFARVPERPADSLLFIANASSKATTATLFLPLPFLFDALPLVDLLGLPGLLGGPGGPGGHGEHHMVSGTLHLTLPPHGVLLLGARDDQPGGYRFFKRDSL